jgi:class 3 adenylate cyclase/tetratricopeptide (TPR) repeat protein
MSSEKAQIEAGIAALESQRAVLGDAVVDLAIAPLLQKLATLADGASTESIPVQHLRQVSILFLDFVGSTKLSEQLDPEDVHLVIDGALSRLTAVVEAHQGRVLGYAGDNLLAVFGGDEAREDDAERAVRAGLVLLDEGRLLGRQIHEQHGHEGFNVRVGVHTGSVLLGGGVDAEGTIRGLSVNIAARMEQTAPAGSLRISQDTYRHVRGVFDLEVQAPIMVKGVERPLVTYLVLGAKPRAFRPPTRGIEGTETPLIGREDELGALSAAFEQTLLDRSPHVTTLIAQAGLGKSRLMHDLQHGLDIHPQTSWLLLGRSQPSSLLQPYGLLRDILAWRLQIADSDSAEAARQRLVEGLAPFFDEDDPLDIELLGQLIGMDFSSSPRVEAMLKDPRLLRLRGFSAFARYIRGLSQSDGSPVVMLLDDLHWTDDASLDWLQGLMKITDLPLMVVMAARPELFERYPKWCASPAHHREITLKPLDSAQRRSLTRSLLERIKDPPQALLDLIETQAEGIPFYAEELVKMLIDTDIIIVEGPFWRVESDRLRQAHIPGTLTGVLQARLDSLPAAERRTLQFASVIGPVFWDDALSSIEPGSEARLAELNRRSLIHVRAESVFENTREESFQHHLLHQVTYNTVLKTERRHAHARAAAWLADRVGDRGAEYLAITAEHFERSGDTARAIDWYRRAIAAAESRYAHSAAVSYITRVLEIPGFSDLDVRIRLYRKLASLADLLGDRKLQLKALDDGERAIDELGDDVARAEHVMDRALLADRVGEQARAESFSREAIALAERFDVANIAALGYGELAWLLRGRGEITQAKVHLETALRWARLAAERLVNSIDDIYEIQLLTAAGEIQRADFDFEAASTTLRGALELAQQRNRLRSECLCNSSLGEVTFELADYALAEHYLEIAKKQAKQQEFGLITTSTTRIHALMALDRGDLAQVRSLSARAKEGYFKIGMLYYAAVCLSLEAEAWSAQGDFSESRRLETEAQALYREHELAADALASRALIAGYVCLETDAKAALELLEPELRALDEPSALLTTPSDLPARLAVWRVLHAAKDERASHHLELAKRVLDRRTEKVTDATVRNRILTHRWPHRVIFQAWLAHQSSPSDRDP